MPSPTAPTTLDISVVGAVGEGNKIYSLLYARARERELLQRLLKVTTFSMKILMLITKIPMVVIFVISYGREVLVSFMPMSAMPGSISRFMS